MKNASEITLENRMACYLWKMGLFALTVVAALGLSWHFISQPLRPWPDQGWVLQAAVRHSQGLGLTTHMNGVGTDLTELTYDHLAYFPPLYPLLVSSLLPSGLKVDHAVKLVNLVALVLGVWGWLSLARRCLSSHFLLFLFACLLVLAGTSLGSAMIPKGGTADYIFWAGMGFWFGFLLTALEKNSKRRRWFSLLGAAFLAAGMIGVRWAAVVLIPAGGLALLWTDLRPVRARLLEASLYGLPGILMYLALGQINRTYSGTGANYLAFIQPRLDFDHLATLYPLECFTTIPLGLEALLKRGWRAIDPTNASILWGSVFRLVFPAFFLTVLILARNKNPKETKSLLPNVLSLLVITAGMFYLFLAFMTVRYNWGDVNWSYLDEPRYFRPLWPAAALFWLVLLEHSGPRRAGLRNLALACLTIAALYLAQAHLRTEVKMLATPDESWELVQRVRGLEDRPDLQVVIDMDISDYIVTAGPNLQARGWPDPSQVGRLSVSRPADLWLVRRLDQGPVYHPNGADPKEIAAGWFDAMARRFQPQKVWTSSQGNYELWHARLEPSPRSF